VLKIHVDKKMYSLARKEKKEARERGEIITYAEAVGRVYAKQQDLINVREIENSVNRLIREQTKQTDIFGKKGGFF